MAKLKVAKVGAKLYPIGTAIQVKNPPWNEKIWGCWGVVRRYADNGGGITNVVALQYDDPADQDAKWVTTRLRLGEFYMDDRDFDVLTLEEEGDDTQ